MKTLGRLLSNPEDPLKPGQAVAGLVVGLCVFGGGMYGFFQWTRILADVRPPLLTAVLFFLPWMVLAAVLLVTGLRAVASSAGTVSTSGENCSTDSSLGKILLFLGILFLVASPLLGVTLFTAGRATSLPVLTGFAALMPMSSVLVIMGANCLRDANER